MKTPFFFPGNKGFSRKRHVKGASAKILWDVQKKDIKALFFIQQAVDDDIFLWISATIKPKKHGNTPK